MLSAIADKSRPVPHGSCGFFFVSVTCVRDNFSIRVNEFVRWLRPRQAILEVSFAKEFLISI